MAEHALQPHVLRLARRLHFAGVVIVEDAVGQLRHGDRRRHAFADVDVLRRVVDTHVRVAAVRDHHVGYSLDVPHEQRDDDDRGAGGDGRPP